MTLPGRKQTPRGRIRLGMVGGGEGAFIAAAHRIASRLDDACSGIHRGGSGILQGRGTVDVVMRCIHGPPERPRRGCATVVAAAARAVWQLAARPL